MGRGDASTRKGKIFAGSFGIRRPHKHHRRTKGLAGVKQRVNTKTGVPARSKA